LLNNKNDWIIIKIIKFNYLYNRFLNNYVWALSPNLLLGGGNKNDPLVLPGFSFKKLSYQIMEAVKVLKAPLMPPLSAWWQGILHP